MKTKIKEKLKNIYTEFKKDKVLQIALVFAIISVILGCVDLKVNAAESYTVNATIERCSESGIDYTSNTAFTSSSPMEVYIYTNYDTPMSMSQKLWTYIYLVSDSNISCGTLQGTPYTMNGKTFYVYMHSFSFGPYSHVANSYFNTYTDTGNDKKLNTCYYTADDFATAYANGSLDIVIDYGSLSVNDDMPIVENLYFDKIEKKENNGVSNVKTITDFIRFEPNSDYKLAIMLCPSIYSTIGDSDYSSKFELYKYDSWVHMTTADVGLKEISCELGQFTIPTNSTDCIISSNYKSYYETICFELSDTGQLVFKPTMGYRLAYVDLENNVIGPSTYIIPNYYNNLSPDEETYSYFVLYSDGTCGSEKIMNLKTWEQENGKTLEDVQDTIVEVGDALKDYVIVDNEVDVQEASNWLYSVVSFIKGTPQVVGSVLGFLPQPILYGMYVTVFLGVIASAIAIVKALF